MRNSKNRLGIILISIIVLITIAKFFAGYYVDFIWFKDLKYAELFLIPILANISLALFIFLFCFIVLFVSAVIVSKIMIKSGVDTLSYRDKVIDITSFVNSTRYYNGQTYRAKIPKKLLLILSIFIGFLSIVFTSGFMENNFAIDYLKYINRTQFNITDMIFNKDISFYIFTLPFVNQVLNIVLAIIGISLFLSFVVFVISGIVNLKSIFEKGFKFLNDEAQKFLVSLLGIGFIVYSIKKYLSMYELIYSKYGYVFGVGNTDVNITIPITKILALGSFIIGVICIVFLIKKNYKAIVGSVILYLILSFMSGIVTFAYQNFYVNNNEFVAERPYIQNQIAFTRLAYGLDDIKTIEYPGNVELTANNIRDNKTTINNIRLNDPKALSKVLSQSQGLRYYYTFGDIDIDRYTLNGKYSQVMIAPREMDKTSFEEGELANTFVNQVMKFTHGYGVAATLANDFDNNGYAKLIIRDIPPKSSVEGLEIIEPRIYFGEMTNDSRYGYVIGNTSAKEFDYPQGDQNIENVYQGSTGIKMNALNKLALSFYNNTFRYYIASEINSDSKLLMRRNIIERVNSIMPYLVYDHDPYIVVDKDGKLYWMIDAYTRTNKFPYSTPYNRDTNYIRNSVKVVVDAYNGEVDFYVFEDEPIVNTLRKAFPNVFKDASDMPSNLIEHIRYPEGLFNTQLSMLRDFHVENPSVFYNREDTWEIAKKAQGNESIFVDSYYTIMKLSGEGKEEFILMNSFTPLSRSEQQRNNLVAWLGARCDGDKYGQLVLYKMPKNVEVQGPLMIDSMIDQDPEISSKMTLWGQGGSNVIRGNLLVVPIDDGFIYVEPIYIEANRAGSSIPQLQAIVLAVDKKVVMVETNKLDIAIQRFFGTYDVAQAPDEKPHTNENVNNTGAIEKQEIINKLRELRKQLEELENDLVKID